MIDNVNHPAHYTNHPAGIECIDVVEHLSFNVGNAIKYLWRANLKGAHIEDLRKAVWYILREIERVEKNVEGSIKETKIPAGVVGGQAGGFGTYPPVGR